MRAAAQRLARDRVRRREGVLINSVATRLGASTVARFERLVGWGDHFQEFDAGASRRSERSRKRRSQRR